MKMRLHKGYLLLAVLLFITELLIALYVRDSFVRPYLGDTLVILLLYCFLRSFLSVKVIPAATAVLFFAFFIEAMQYLDLLEHLGLQDNRVAMTILGHSFAWEDIWAYVAGYLLILLGEYLFRKSSLYRIRS